MSRRCALSGADARGGRDSCRRDADGADLAHALHDADQRAGGDHGSRPCRGPPGRKRGCLLLFPRRQRRGEPPRRRGDARRLSGADLRRAPQRLFYPRRGGEGGGGYSRGAAGYSLDRPWLSAGTGLRQAQPRPVHRRRRGENRRRAVRFPVGQECARAALDAEGGAGMAASHVSGAAPAGAALPGYQSGRNLCSPAQFGLGFLAPSCG